ncbi:MAG: hypothetical protein HFE39_00800 [Clostridiales bacterium]|jgi:hypothetical protein|nr:hypothetical protein [Clostridiales bacterium]
MKNSSSNILTVMLASLVLIAGALFGFFILPIITEDSNGNLETFSAEVNTPQEIIQKVPQQIACQKYFPYTYSEHKLLDNNSLNEDDTINRKAFLDQVSKQLNILFNLKIDSIILEKYALVWRYTGDSSSEEMDLRRADDVYFIDVLFTDAKMVQWRITAGGYSDSIFYLSCLENEKYLSTPVFPTTITSSPKEIDFDQKMEKAVSRFRSKLYDPGVFPTLFDSNSSYQPLDLFFYDSNNPQIYWVLCLEYDGRYLLSAYSAAGNVPLCYSFLNLQQETQSYTDFLWELYN